MSTLLSSCTSTFSPRFSFLRASRRRVTARRLASVVVFATAKGASGHAGTRARENFDPPSPGRHKSHLPLVTDIEYDPVPPNAVKLPAPDLLGQHHAPFEHVVSSRRSCRDFSTFPEKPEGEAHAYVAAGVHLYEVSQLVWAAQGITEAEQPADEFGHAAAAKRAVASGGRLYPLTAYVVVNANGVGGLEHGAYEYLPSSHSLLKVTQSTCTLDGERGAGDEVLDEDEYGTESNLGTESSVTEDTGDNSVFDRLVQSTVPQIKSKTSQSWASSAPLLLLIVGDVSKTKQHGGLYETFGEELMQLETGMVGATVQLQATALGLGVTPIGAFDTNEASRVVFGDTKHTPGVPKLMLVIGVPKGSYREKVGHVRWEDEDEVGEAR